MSEIQEEPKVEPENGKLKPEPEKPIVDFKVAEIWIKSGQVMLEASEAFWQDKCRALGLLEFCKDIVKNAEPPKNKIIPVTNSMINYAKNLAGRFRRKR